ncbi:MAG: ribonuclease III [Actinobacteria bacterium]|nr:MAG: ribonuclease III [Actinomycetota bacterium]
MIDALSPELAETVFTHTSWASERGASYERLEFLGDSVLELAVAHALYARHPDFSEGRLAKVRSHVVSRATCAEVARELDLGKRLVERAAATQTQDELERLARNRNVLAAVIEAALGALFLQHGFAAIEDAVVAAFSQHIEQALTTRVDQKTDLQELLARSGRHVTYVEISVEGPPHERSFTCAAIVDGEELGRGEGRTKKAAEQEAAREALEKLDGDEA